MGRLKVAWVHSFRTERLNSGVFMHGLVDHMHAAGVQLSLLSVAGMGGAKAVAKAGLELRSATDGYDIVHAQYGSGCGAAAAFARGRRVLTLRGTDWYGMPSVGTKAERVRSAAGAILSRASLARYNRILTVSERMRVSVSKWVDASKVLVLPSAVDLNRFLPIERRVARSQLGFGGDESPWVLFSSAEASNAVKRPALAREAVAQARRLMPEIKCMEVSGVPHAEIPLLVNACDVLLLTSTHEGWPNVVKEALACGVPFVSTDVSDLSVIAAREPSCAVVPDTPHALGSAIAEAVRAGRKHELRRHVEHMDAPLVAARLAQIYHEVL